MNELQANSEAKITSETVHLDGNVETQLKVKAEAFAMRVFDNLESCCKYPGVIDAAVEIYKLSTSGQTIDQLKELMLIED